MNKCLHPLFMRLCSQYKVVILIDSEIDLTTRNGNTRVFINSR
jgi:hypothetical protein